MDKKLTLHDFLKLLTNNNVPVSKAMAVASKMFKEYNTPALLAQLDDAKLQVLDVKDKDLRKLVLAAIHKAGYIRLIQKPDSECDCLEEHVSNSKPSSTVQPLISPKRKRKRDNDLNEFLPEASPDEGSTYESMDFHEVLDEEILRSKSTVVNRAPLMTAWATIVAERLGFDREEALSIGSVYTEMNAITKGISLGIIDQSKKKEIEPLSDGQQPYVDLMGRRPLYKTQSSKWRALVGGSPAAPSTAFSYISRAFRQTTPNIVGALRLLAESYPPQELNKAGFSLYADFRPTVDGWGKRGEVRCEYVMSLRKKGAGKPVEGHVSDTRYDNQEPVADHPPKRMRKSSPDGYEAAFDFELDQEALSNMP